MTYSVYQVDAFTTSIFKGNPACVVPLDKWLLNDLKYLVDSSTKNKILESLGIENKSIVEEWKNDFFNGKVDNSWKLWTLITYAKWAEINNYV